MKKNILLRIDEEILNELDKNLKDEKYPINRTALITKLIIDYNDSKKRVQSNEPS